MEEEPLLTGSINQGSGDYGSHDNCEHYQHEESPGSRRLSYSVTDDSYPVHEGTYVLSAWPECLDLAFTSFWSADLLLIIFLCVLFNKSLKVVSLWGWYHQGRPWLTRGPVRGMEWGPPRSVCNGVTGGGSIPFVAGRGARCDRTSCTAQRTALGIIFIHLCLVSVFALRQTHHCHLASHLLWLHLMLSCMMYQITSSS